MDAIRLLLLLVVAGAVLWQLVAPRGPRMDVHQLHQAWVATPPASDTLLIDVREAHEFAAGHVAGARNLPVGQLESRLAEVTAARRLLVVCLAGGRSAAACRLLRQRLPACEVVDVTGGMQAWQAAGLPVAH